MCQPWPATFQELALGTVLPKLSRMKLLWVTLAHILIVAVLGGGILLLMAGKPALLLGGLVVYALAFAKAGCASH